jgi:hypothetical protein
MSKIFSRSTLDKSDSVGNPFSLPLKPRKQAEGGSSSS